MPSVTPEHHDDSVESWLAIYNWYRLTERTTLRAEKQQRPSEPGLD